MDNKDSLSSEATFFRQHSVFKGLPSSFFGVPNLTRRLTDLLVGRIKAALPSIKWEVRQYEDDNDDDNDNDDNLYFFLLLVPC